MGRVACQKREEEGRRTVGKRRERAVDGVTEDGKRGKGEKKEEREERE